MGRSQEQSKKTTRYMGVAFSDRVALPGFLPVAGSLDIYSGKWYSENNYHYQYQPGL